MKLLKKLAWTTVLAASMGAAQAQTVLNDWVFNPNGGGFDNGQEIDEYLDVNGNAFITLNPSGESSFTFREYAVFNLTQADSNGRLFPINYAGGNISAIFEGYGTGTFNGQFTFTGGTIRMFQNPADGQYGSTEGIYGADVGNLIGTFNVLAGGGGSVDASGNPIGNGQVSVWAQAAEGALESGYFFRGNGDDLSEESVLAFAFTNANAISNPNATLVDEVACQFGGFQGAGCNGSAYANAPGEYFFIGGNGQFKLNEIESEVPEPGSLALFGIAMLGAGMAARKRARKS